jgi:hypothetical protein
MTFLRGAWMPTQGSEPQWTPLPSQILKLGKIVYGDVELSPLKTAMFARGLSQSFKGVHRDTPIIGPFLAMYDRLGVEPDAKVARALASQRRYGISLPELQAPPDREAIIRMYWTRYHLTREDVERLESIFRNNQTLPVFHGDPAYIKLATDYGVLQAIIEP